MKRWVISAARLLLAVAAAALVSGRAQADEVGPRLLLSGALACAPVPVARQIVTLGNRLLVTAYDGKVWTHDISATRVSSPVLLSGAPVATAPMDKQVMAMDNRLLVLTYDGKVKAYDVPTVRGPRVLSGEPVATAPIDKFVVAMGHRLLVIRSDGTVWAHDVDANATSGSPVYLLSGSMGVSVAACKHMVAMGNRLLAITDGGQVWAHYVGTTSVSGGQRPLTGALVASTPGDKFVVAMGDSLLVICRDGSVWAHYMPIPNILVTREYYIAKEGCDNPETRTDFIPTPLGYHYQKQSIGELTRNPQNDDSTTWYRATPSVSGVKIEYYARPHPDSSCSVFSYIGASGPRSWVGFRVNVWFEEGPAPPPDTTPPNTTPPNTTPSPVQLADFTITPSSVGSGENYTLRVTLNRPAVRVMTLQFAIGSECSQFYLKSWPATGIIPVGESRWESTFRTDSTEGRTCVYYFTVGSVESGNSITRTLTFGP